MASSSVLGMWAMASAVLLLAPAARAQSVVEAPPPGELRAVPGGVLVVSLNADAPLDAAAVRGAIARELGVRVEDPGSAPRGSPRLDLRISDGGRQLDARFSAQNRTLVRTIRLPEQPQAALETIALLAGNLVRNEAEELLAELERRRAAEAAEAAAAGGSTVAPEAAAPEPAAPPQAAPAPKPAAPPPAPKSAPAPSTAAPPPPRAGVPINLTLLYPSVSLHRHSERYTFALELGVVYARLGRVEGAAIDLFVHRIDHGLDGAGLTTIWSHVDGDVRGAVLSGIGSSGTGKLEGAQLTGVTAIHHGGLEGVQGSVVSLAWDDVEGAQLGVANWAERIQGAQLGAVNVSGGAHGAELGAVNAAGRIQGAQLGAINVAGTADAAQIGMVNIAGRSGGAQVGLVNVAGSAEGEQVGLINIGSRLRPTSWVDVDADGDVTAHAGLKFQSRTFYSLLGFGVGVNSGSEQRYASTAALGLRLSADALFFQADAGMAAVHANDFSGDSPGSVRYRAMAGVHVSPWLSLFAGGGVEHRILPDQGGPRGLGLAGIEIL